MSALDFFTLLLALLCPSFASSSLTSSSTASPTVPVMDYVFAGRTNLPASYQYHYEFAVSSDPDHPNILYYVDYSHQIFRRDLNTSVDLQPLILNNNSLESCGITGEPSFRLIVALRSSLMVYHNAWPGTNQAVLEIDTTTGECLRDWHVPFVTSGLYVYQLVVDELRQRFAVVVSPTPTLDLNFTQYSVTLVSMHTSDVIASIPWWNERLYFDKYSQDYFLGFGSINQLSGEDLSFVRAYTPYKDDNQFIFVVDQLKTFIFLGLTSLGYFRADNTWHALNVPGQGTWSPISSWSLNGDLLVVRSGNPCTIVSWRPQPSYIPSSSSASAHVDSSSSTGTSSIVGDPSFVGLRGQHYQVHGIDGEVYALISDSLVQINAKFSFLESGECLRDAEDRPLFTCWTHAGSYLTSLSVRLGSGEVLQIIAGMARDGFSSVNLSSNKSALDLTAGKPILTAGMNVNYQDLRTVVINYAGLYSLTVENSDCFLNIVSLKVNDWNRLTKSVRSHGLLGQTWRTDVNGVEVLPVEGWVDDYVVEDGLMGCNFTYALMHC